MASTSEADAGVRGSQTLLRGLDVLDIVSRHGPIALKELTERIGLPRSTTYRLAAALADRGYLAHDPRGYCLGSKLLGLEALAREATSLINVARPHLEKLTSVYLDPANLAVRDGEQLRYVDQVRGSRRIEVRPVIGETRPLTSTGLGKALLLDEPAEAWRASFQANPESPQGANGYADWVARMQDYRSAGVAFDIEENADKVRCVAAPIRDASGKIIAAFSLSSLPQYMDDTRMRQIVEPVRATADAISEDLGWRRR